MEGIFTGKSLEEVRKLAADSFGVDEEKIDFEIIEEPKKGIFGKIKGEAKVKAVYNPTRTEIAVNYLQNIISNLNIKCNIISEEKEGFTLINIEGDTIGTIIGRRGETLDSLQYLTSMIANKDSDDYHRIVLDSNGYREKRKNTLIELAEKVSKSVIRTGRSSALEPMNPYERRIIHAKVSEIEGVYSRSIGEEPHRKVIIYPENKKNDKSGGGSNFKKKKKKIDGPKSLDLRTSFEKDYKKPGPDDNINTGLYGKLDI